MGFMLKRYSVILTTSQKKNLFLKFQLIPILRFQIMRDYECFIAPIDYCVK